MQFFDAFLSAAKSSLANCAITLQNATNSSSPPSPGVPTGDLVTPLASTTSTSSFPLLSGSSTKRKARRSLLQQLPLPGGSIDNSPPSLSKGKRKSRILERFRDGLRSEKSRRRNPVPKSPYNSSCPNGVNLPTSTSPPSTAVLPSTPSHSEPATSVDDITMHEDEHLPAGSAQSSSSPISCPTPLRPSPRRRPCPTPLQSASSSTKTSSSSSLSSSSSSRTSSSSVTSKAPSTQGAAGSWIDPSKLAPPHFHSFVRHQADVYHTLITLSSASLFSEDGDGYMSFLRPILPDDASTIELLRAAEKQLMARLYFWLILRGAKAWILPLDHRTSISAPASRKGNGSPLAEADTYDNDTVPADTSSTPVSLSPPLPPSPEPVQALIGDGVFPSFSHLIAYLLRMQNQPRRRERGAVPRSSSSKHVGGVGRWRPPISSPLRWTVVTDFCAEENDQEDAKAVAESLLESIDEEESIMEEGSESWFDMLGELDDEDMGSDTYDDDDEDDEEVQVEEEMDEDDREWARLRFQMAMDIERKTWSNTGDLDLDRRQIGEQDRPGSPTPDSLKASEQRQRTIERHSGDVEQYEYVQGSVSSHVPAILSLPTSRPNTSLQKRSLSDSDLETEDSATNKRRKFSPDAVRATKNYALVSAKDRRPALVHRPRMTGCRNETNSGRKLRRRVSGSSLGGSIAAL